MTEALKSRRTAIASAVAAPLQAVAHGPTGVYPNLPRSRAES